MSAADASTWMARLASLAVVIAALELLVVRRALGEQGSFRWSILGRDYGPRLRTLLTPVFGTRGITAILVLQLASGVALPLVAHPLVPAMAAATTLAIAVRFRGTFNGGSDSMLLVVLVALALPGRSGLALAAIQLVLSYAIAGLAKLGDPAWRRGTALATLVQLPHYAVPRALAPLLSGRLGRVTAFAMLAFECTFPLALVDPAACTAYLAVGAAFHLGNAITFGLNRFLWTWLAAYPALMYWS